MTSNEDLKNHKPIDDFATMSLQDKKTQTKLWRRKKIKLKVNDEKKPSMPPPLPPVSFFQLFRFATRFELFLIGVAVVAAIGIGILMPLLIILYGEFTEVLIDNELENQDSSPDENHHDRFYIFIKKYSFGKSSNTSQLGIISDQPEFMQSVTMFGIMCSALGLMQMVLDYIFIVCLTYTAEKQILRIRTLFLRQVLRQDIGWYDTNQTGDFASRLAEDLVKLHDGISEKIGMFTFQFSTFITSIIIAFVYGWQLTLVVLSCMPFLIASTAFVAKMQSSLTERELQAYASAGSVCEEVLSSIRTVMAFGGQDKETKRYIENLDPARRTGLRRGWFTGAGNGVMWFITFATYSIAFWYGVGLVIEGREEENPTYTPATLAIVFFNVLFAAMMMGQATPFLEAFSMARGAASMVFFVIDREPIIDSLGEGGACPSSVDGRLSFRDIIFRYPSRPEVVVLQDLSLDINRGETVALVGASGCGKSTCLQLLQRFYDPHSGVVSLDGIDIKTLNVGWLRNQIGVVGQEPVLFDATIAENIRYGNPDASLEEIRLAAKEAQADDFIMKLPKQYETMVGERGAQLSGGQKQRIAIARALVGRPAILLLDEATSALDSNSESQVQQALDQASKGRTTIIVAHRLSTVRGADRIVVLGAGRVVEEGTHEQLMEQHGVYYELIAAQTRQQLEVEKLSNHTANIPENAATHQGVRDRRSSSKLSAVVKFVDEPNTKLEDYEEETEAPMTKILKLNKAEWKEILLGCIGSFIVGCSMPTFAVLFGDIYGILSLPEAEDVRAGTNLYSILFLVTGIITGIGAFFQMYMFNVAGVKLTMRLREMSFGAMLRQEPAWFDDQQNSTGALCARLSGDAASVQGATGSRLGTIFQTIATLSLGLGLALYYSWKLGLVTAAFVPVVLFAIILEARVSRAQNIYGKNALESASKVATESIANIRTVAGLARERDILAKYTELLEAPHDSSIRIAHLRGLVFGFGQSMPFFAYGISLYYGGYLVYYEDLHYKNIIKVTEALIYGTMMLGQAMAFAPDFNLAKVAANKIIRLLERMPLIYDTTSSTVPRDWCAEGEVSYREVDFSYPSRPRDPVLRGLTLQARLGQTVALVGSSGCGKSTCLQLLLRFYEPSSGSVTLDDKEVSSLTLDRLRAQLGIVSQEPVLFDRTLAENIAYGDNSREVAMVEVISAAQQANIHNFIVSLPQGYETRLGERGAQLSGGQKQRVAIARALVRNPRVLLLDEATSALDAESEKVVQAALDSARRGRTCIVIAHRLSTVQDADVICVVERGRIVESGRHAELLEKRGAYYRLHTLQSS